MDEKKELQELLQRLDRSNRKQAWFAGLQVLFSLIAAVCCVAALLTVVSFLPKLEATVEQVDAVLANVEQVSDELAKADVAGVMANLEEVSTQMAEADLAGLVDNVNALVDTSQTGIEDALNKLNAIDLETLNQAIQDLADVVQPIAKLFNRF